MADLNSVYKDAKMKMVKPIKNLEDEYKKIRGARASSGLVENVNIELENGKVSPLKTISNITTPDARTIMISPWEPSNINSIEKSLLKENLNMTPSNDGKNIRMVLPQMTEETRKDMVKIIKQKSEEAKVAERNIRHELIKDIKKLEKSEEISEDERKSGETKLTDFTNKAINKIDKMFQDKEKEIMTI